MSADINNEDQRFELYLPFEDDVKRNQYSVRHWMRYIDFRKQCKAPVDEINIVYERALENLPGSYKFWYEYLKHRKEAVKDAAPFSQEIEEVNECYERSLIFMHKMPRIWIEYLTFLVDQNLITRTRRAFDKALQALPVTQHNRIWPSYIDFIKSHNIPETAFRVYKRYLKLMPEDAEEFVEYLLSMDRLNEAAIELYKIVNNENFLSKHGKSRHQLWNELCTLMCKNPRKIHSLKVENIIRQGIDLYKDEQGRLWTSLAQYYIRSGLLERARDIYEEAITSVVTIKDFALIFEAYTQSEEAIIKKRMNAEDLTDDDEIEIEMRMARYENLIEMRPLLLNSVALKQNPHNVDEWLKRVKLLEGKPLEIIETYAKAIDTIVPKLAIGKYSIIWIEFAKFYETNEQIEEARLIFEKAVEANYAKVDDLVAVWCEYAEMELRHGSSENALQVMQRATATPESKAAYHDQNEPVQRRIFRSLKLWSFYADLEESFGSFDSTKSVYERIIDLRIATPQIIMNYALFLEENNYYEESFKAYEKGVSIFKWPNVKDIWSTYLSKFLIRYGGKKLDRGRDLFEQCLDQCPTEYCKSFYILYAKLEEEHGLMKHAMTIYERAANAVEAKDKMEMYNIYIKKVAQMFGVTYTRSIYEKAIEALPDGEAREMCMKFADLEQKLGEIDRARVIYTHCSQFCDPRTGQHFWDTWKAFEIKHGNEDSIREMLRIKRSVHAKFNTTGAHQSLFFQMIPKSEDTPPAS